jgi:hypothetical protein
MASIGLCHYLQPGRVRRGVPLSHFGVLRASRVAFAFGFGVSALCIATASVRLLDTMPYVNAVQLILGLTALCMVGIVATPYSTKYLSLYCLHILFAFIVFVMQVVAGLWIALLTDNWLNWLLYGLVLVGGVLIFLSIRSIRVLASFALGQMLIINAFTLMMVRTIAVMS